MLIKYKKSAINLGKSLYLLIIMHAEGEICYKIADQLLLREQSFRIIIPQYFVLPLFSFSLWSIFLFQTEHFWKSYGGANKGFFIQKLLYYLLKYVGDHWTSLTTRKNSPLPLYCSSVCIDCFYELSDILTFGYIHTR